MGAEQQYLHLTAVAELALMGLLSRQLLGVVLCDKLMPATGEESANQLIVHCINQPYT
jgi:hypothetical protein